MQHITVKDCGKLPLVSVVDTSTAIMQDRVDGINKYQGNGAVSSSGYYPTGCGGTAPETPKN